MTPNVIGLEQYKKPGRKSEIQLTDTKRTKAHLYHMYAYVIKGKRYDAGDKFGFLKATVEFGLKHPEVGTRFAGYLKQLSI
jgi:UTP--glucose-1-phosphate uridylyltransferase